MSTIILLAVVCSLVGALLGFIGAGGAGITVSLLTVVFGLSIHQAVGTALAAMCCVSIAGAISHYREGNMVPRVGFVVGIAGMIGAWLGASIGQHIPEHPLQIAAGLTLWLLAALVWVRTRVARQVITSRDPAAGESGHTVATAVGLGASGGVAAAFFGVGMTPYLQLGMLQALKLDLRQTVGTTMLALIFISLSGSLTLATHGDVSLKYLIGVMIGMTAGSYLGAKLTMRAHPLLLRIGVVATPFVAGAMLIFF